VVERTDVTWVVYVCRGFFCGFEFFGHAGYVPFCVEEGAFVFFEVVFQSGLFDFEFDVLRLGGEGVGVYLFEDCLDVFGGEFS
jgi:hypothetical protein